MEVVARVVHCHDFFELDLAWGVVGCSNMAFKRGRQVNVGRNRAI